MGPRVTQVVDGPLGDRVDAVRPTRCGVSCRPADPCDLTLEGGSAGIVEGSLTGWVRHPRDLDTWWDHLGAAEKAERQPNAVRWMIVFDASTSAVPEMITGVVEIEIAATLE